MVRSARTFTLNDITKLLQSSDLIIRAIERLPQPHGKIERVFPELFEDGVTVSPHHIVSTFYDTHVAPNNMNNVDSYPSLR